MNTRQLEYIIAIAEAGSFSQAARTLYVSQPSLSQYVQKLEKELGVALFERGTPLRLTYAGEVYVESARGILERERETLRVLEDIARGECNRVRVGAGPYSGAFVLAAAIRRFGEKYPKAQFELIERVEPELPELLRQGKCDLVVTTQPMDDPAFTGTPLISEDFILAVPRSFRLNDRYQNRDGDVLQTIDLQECRDYPFIVLSGQPYSRRVFQDLCETRSFVPRITVKCVNLVTAYMQALAGNGIAFLPSSALLLPQQSQNCCYYRIQGNPYRRNLSVVYRKNEYLTQASICVINILKEVSRDMDIL